MGFKFGAALANMPPLLLRRPPVQKLPPVPEPEPEMDEWAPCPTCKHDKYGHKVGVRCKCACIDVNGYHRRQHTLDREGCCIYLHMRRH